MRQQRRVAVTSPQTRLALTGRRTGAPVAPPHLGPELAERARGIHRRQLRAALGVLVVLAVVLLGLPLLLAALPVLDTVRLLGVPVSWIAIAVLPYPLLTLLAHWQLRTAERIERQPVGPGTETGGTREPS